MIPFQLRTFLETVLTLPDSREQSLRRMIPRVLFAIGFPAFELLNTLLLALDYVCFPRFISAPVERPVFIIGNPRGGTTLLHRLLSRDVETFTSILAWQLLLPSLVGQTAIAFLAAIDRSLGAPAGRLIMSAQERWLQEADRIHRTRLDLPEEDEVLLMHAFASDLIALLFPVRAEAAHELFDDLPEPTRRGLMRFYRRCVQRHLFLHARGRELLSKSPLFCTKVRSIYETFPGARVIYLVRDPAEAIASVLNMVNEIWRAQGVGAAEIPDVRNERVVAWAVLCYRHVLNVLDRAPRERHVLVRYEDLVGDPQGTVEYIYQALDIPLSAAYRSRLESEVAGLRAYRSRHEYSLDRFGFSHGQIEALVPQVYDRFGYRRRAGVVRAAAGT